MKTNRQLSPSDGETLLKVLEARFMKNIHRHPDMDWVKVSERLRKDPIKLWSLNEMERTGGEPDVTGVEPITGAIIFVIVRCKVLRGAEASVTTARPWNRAGRTSRWAARWKWLRLWVLRC